MICLTKLCVLWQRSAQAAVKHSDRIFTEIIRSIQIKQAEVREKIRAQENKEVRDAESHIQRLREEIVKLQEETCKLEPLLHTEDHVYFSQVKKNILNEILTVFLIQCWFLF